MTAPLSLRRILTLGAALETPVGLGLLAAPSALAEILLQSPLSGAGLSVARLGGGALVALGVACWCARETPSTPAGRGVARGFLAYNVVACGVLIQAQPPLPEGLAALGAAVLHGFLAAALVLALLMPGRVRTGA
jgi:hypothetical protein